MERVIVKFPYVSLPDLDFSDHYKLLRIHIMRPDTNGIKYRFNDREFNVLKPMRLKTPLIIFSEWNNKTHSSECVLLVGAQAALQDVNHY
jgi:hypothetical protein